MSTALHKKGSRSAHGCQTCRARKIRCDERPGVCYNCEKLGLPCAGPVLASEEHQSDATTPTRPVVTSGLKRKRTFRSCTNCRSTKTRCSGDKPACAKCRDKAVQCTYDDASEPTWRQQLKFAMMQQQSQSPDDVPHQQLFEGEGDIAATRSMKEPEDSNNSSSEGATWLRSQRLPEKRYLLDLVKAYFANIHPLRCFGFLHKPSFMQRLDAADSGSHEDDALLHIVCALGALFYAGDRVESQSAALSAGKQWAKRAQQLILAQLGDICVENLMAAILLHDYELRMANFGNAFMLSGLTARMAQALQINLEHSTDILCQDPDSDPGASTKESRRRLMWCCYVTDSLVGSGVDQLTLIKESDIKIQLPCNERNFLLQKPCITEVLEPGQFLRFLPADVLPTYPLDNMGVRSYYLRFISIRRKVLKYIKHLDKAKDPWLPDSEFAELDTASRKWYASLPDSLQFNPNAIYIRKETSQLGMLCALHYMYHQNMCDLYRIGAPALYKLRAAFKFPPEQRPFLHHLQDELFEHAKKLAIITGEALRNGPHALADSWIPTVVYDCCRVLLYYVTQLIDPNAEGSKRLLSETIPLIQSNAKALRAMQSMYVVAELLANAAERMLEKIGIGSGAATSGRKIIPDEPYPNNDSDENENERSQPGTPVQSAPDYVLNPLSIYRMARKGIPEKHAPEKQPNASSPAANAGGSARQRRATLQHIHYERDTAPAPAPAPAPVSTTTELPAGIDQAGFDELLSLFTTDPSGWSWQPSDTAIGSHTESNGLPPWEPTYVDQQLDAWLPMFSQSQPFGY